MPKESIIVVPDGDTARLRAISECDLENLRMWRNRFRQRFFFKGVIDSEQQARWYAGFRTRPDDYMFMVEARDDDEYIPFGCMGFRLVEGVVDVYNVIRGRASRGGGPTMRSGLALMCSFAISFKYPITLKVLKDNPAVSWYERSKFVEIAEQPDCYIMRLDSEGFAPIRYRLEAIL